VFDTRLLIEAHRLSDGSEMYTDDGALIERYGSPVRVYPGAYTNLKVTTPEDFILAEALLRQREIGPNPRPLP
jgi:2-C-methyl-D-erythritol 4-phosphate cytidylyltransferase